jgi:hypothetical protein
MHFEVPKAKKFKEFGGEYLMIVISILTALALEHGVQTWHHRHLASEAGEKIEVELRENVKDLTASWEYNEQKRQALQQARNQLLAAIRGKASEAELMQRFEREWRPALAMSLKSPSLRREAWEAAVANQAVTWMPREALERYSTAYGSLRDASAFTQNSTRSFLDWPRLRDVMSNTQMGVSNPQEIYRAMNQMMDAYDNFDENLKALNELLQQTLAENDKTKGARITMR